MSSTEIDPLRYGGNRTYDPDESPGIIVDMIPHGASVLDVGCGTGAMSKLIVETKSAHVVGLEPNSERAKAARSQSIEVICDEFNEKALSRLRHFDVILFSDVLEHFVTPSDALSLARRHLAPNGFIIASVPNVAHWTVRYNLMRGRFDYSSIGIMDVTHLRWFTRKTLQQLFESAGLQIDRIQGSSGTWMEEYNLVPWKWIPMGQRRTLISFAARKRPELFACQFVIKSSVLSTM